METDIKRASPQDQANFEQPRQTKIIIRRTFGDQNLLELYADYIAGKIMEEMRQVNDPDRSPT